MLVISRKEDRRVLLELGDGRRIKLTVVQVRPDGAVRLGIEAPPEVRIYRVDDAGNIEGTPKARVDGAGIALADPLVGLRAMHAAATANGFAVGRGNAA